MNKRLFISKQASELDPYRSELDHFSIEAHSFLSFESVAFDIRHPYEVIFFGSPRTVIFFKAQASISTNSAIACIGNKTAELLREMGHRVDFVGEKSGNPTHVGEAFRFWLGKRRVLFPLSDRSLKSISAFIEPAHKEEVVAYKTVVTSQEISPCDIYVFTSPTNVEGFLEHNIVPEYARVIAWGKSTETALISRAVPVEFCLKTSSFEELISLLLK